MCRDIREQFRLAARHVATGPLLVAIGVFLVLCGSAARAQNACCLPAAACQPAADATECNGLGGVLLEGEDCATDPCAPAACCVDTDCATADAFSCITAGREYAGAGTTCLDDPCDSNTGACCLGDGTCLDESPDNCATAGGVWQGAGTDCSDGLCQLGGCCSPGLCEDVALYECNAQGGVHTAGSDCVTDPCSIPNDCATNSLYSQTRDNPNGFTGYTSELSAGLQRFENYTGAVGEIDSLTWWGFDLDLLPSGDFVECVESNNQFDITFHEDAAGLPGPAVCSYDLAVTAVDTGINYGGVFLIEYTVDLPTPCVLSSGWVSLVGKGDGQCWFLWVSSPEGDEFSYCQGCQESLEPDDLAICIGGDFGGVFGSCCDQSTGGCTDNVEIQNCTGVGKRFTADTPCAALDPPCSAETGACCFADGSPCSVELPSSCEVAGGSWLGAGADCSLCPVLGACCFDVDACGIETEDTCDALGFTWLGEGTECTQCPTAPECSVDSLFSQSSSPPSDFLAGTSESGAFQRWENFTGVAGAIDGLTWWGLDQELVGVNFIECVETNNEFQISFHKDAGGVPGPAVCSYVVPSSYDPSILKYNGATLNEYGVTLPAPCVLVNGWVSIVGLGDPDCWFLWMSSDTIGDSYCEGCIPNEQDIDLSLCFDGQVGGIFGACCADTVGVCLDDTEITGCLQPSRRFVPDTLCDALDPPCGTIIGACCFDDATCSIEEEPDCAAAGGSWLGKDTLCDQCPCVVPCPDGGLPEGEPVCGNGYVDTFNAGCQAVPANFSPISLGDSVCGESGVFLDGAEAAGDFDWYEVTVTEPVELLFTVDAEFPFTAQILDGNAGCAGGANLDAEFGEVCDSITASAAVDAGTYWLVVGPTAFQDTTGCPAPYTATLVGNPIDLTIDLDPITVRWDPVPGATSYDVVKGDLNVLRSSSGDFTASTRECLADDSLSSIVGFLENPGPGEGLWVVVRASGTAGEDTYDSGGAGQIGARDAEINASPDSCP